MRNQARTANRIDKRELDSRLGMGDPLGDHVAYLARGETSEHGCARHGDGEWSSRGQFSRKRVVLKLAMAVLARRRVQLADAWSLP